MLYGNISCHPTATRSDRYHYPSVTQKETEPQELRHLPQITQLGRCRTGFPQSRRAQSSHSKHGHHATASVCPWADTHTPHSGPAWSFEAVAWERVFSGQASGEGGAPEIHPSSPCSTNQHRVPTSCQRCARCQGTEQHQARSLPPRSPSLE